MNEWMDGEWIGKVRDILVFIMCHMQFENGCFCAVSSISAVSGDSSQLLNMQFSWERLSFEKKERDF